MLGREVRLTVISSAAVLKYDAFEEHMGNHCGINWDQFNNLVLPVSC